MAEPKDISIDDIAGTIGLDPTKAQCVEMFRHCFSAATTDGRRKMLITAILCETSSPHRMVALADLILNAAAEATGQRNAFTR
jgi:hypothetical protein